ncbi:hypothetical protein CDAR_429071 [Caerostris darwini]|uniref:Uncharacterized protein n=1 Tax=Caerostris darwini TaxID=1538125 RepID=A0AAV4TZT4_9ARAC|nr:hypothetical protein CDAR_429071 [Caerostris darwini]
MGDVVGCPRTRGVTCKKCLPVGPLPGRPPVRMVGPPPNGAPSKVSSQPLSFGSRTHQRVHLLCNLLDAEILYFKKEKIPFPTKLNL